MSKSTPGNPWLRSLIGLALLFVGTFVLNASDSLQSLITEDRESKLGFLNSLAGTQRVNEWDATMGSTAIGSVIAIALILGTVKVPGLSKALWRRSTPATSLRQEVAGTITGPMFWCTLRLQGNIVVLPAFVIAVNEFDSVAIVAAIGIMGPLYLSLKAVLGSDIDHKAGRIIAFAVTVALLIALSNPFNAHFSPLGAGCAIVVAFCYYNFLATYGKMAKLADEGKGTAEMGLAVGAAITAVFSLGWLAFDGHPAFDKHTLAMMLITGISSQLVVQILQILAFMFASERELGVMTALEPGQGAVVTLVILGEGITLRDGSLIIAIVVAVAAFLWPGKKPQRPAHRPAHRAKKRGDERPPPGFTPRHRR